MLPFRSLFLQAPVFAAGAEPMANTVLGPVDARSLGLTLMGEALSRATGVHIVASTGQGPENMLGGYFLTPQTNPPTPWPAQKFAELFGREVNEGMVVPLLERRATAGLICTAVSEGGMTPTDGRDCRRDCRDRRDDCHRPYRHNA